MRKARYRPPYTVSGRAMGMMAEIGADLERYRILLEGPDGVRLRKVNHVRTLRGTTAIEGNTLSEEQITAILAGKRVSGSRREIAEVECAHRAYLEIEKFDPYSMGDLLKAHGLMTAGLVGRPGKWRNCNVGVVGANGAVCHMAPPWGNVPRLMRELFGWLAESGDPVLVKSCVFHYELEFIHPFPDGNGRMGRLWQTALLGSWRREFYGVPVENIVWAHQAEYYAAIQEATARGDSGPFIDFMLDKILRVLETKGEEGKMAGESAQKSRQKSDQKIADLMRERPEITIAELAEATGLSASGVKKNIRKLKDANRIRRVGPDKGGHWEVA
ncbi:MAG: Fic family protein [Kiritimatiellae bacterium]|nr:Fic family protein [Kiritimatiellia bacterium]